jgi:excisionase family DNA binding protein
MAKRKPHDQWFTTTEAARLFGLSHMTVIRRFDSGDIEGFRVPGSRFRRIPRESLLSFARKHRMPLPEAFGDGADASEAQPSGASSRRVLIVEDERRMAELLAKIMTSDGWEVKTARNGFDAGFFAGSFVPDLILLDIMLPGLDGREACRLLRGDARLAGTRILAVTALSDEKNVREILESGVDGHMAKPFGIKELREKIAGLMAGESKVAAGGSGVKEAAGKAD